ncbi:hypothetical protein C8Q75DRAFT_802372 [Abortiporus biennis]|nr:hypothetical protein C8Q75DRAFT_802372 [Abortiporus biennis]
MAEPITPDSSFRSRFKPTLDPHQNQGQTSPTLTSASSQPQTPTFDSALGRSMFGKSLFQSRSSSPFSTSGSGVIDLGTPPKTLVVRTDHSLVTCFDPQDKELYDLWAPK